MPSAIIDGIETHYRVLGDGPAILMFSPGGFDATLDKWTTLGVYARIKLLAHLPKSYRCIVFDRRETGLSGGRIERIGWDHYVDQGNALLEHLGETRAHVLGGCMGCCPVLRFAVRYPQVVRSMILYWPVGGARYRIRGHARMAEHLRFVAERGLAAVVALAHETDAGFGKDPRIGPWAPVIRADASFADRYAQFDVTEYRRIVNETVDALFDRDTAPGAEPEELFGVETPALIVPGKDAAHATSAARYLEECLPRAQYWDLLPDEQTEANIPAGLLEFLGRVG